MKKFYILLFICSWFSQQIFAQDMNSVFPKHVMLLGGDRKISKVRTLVIDLEIQTAQGTLPAKIKIINEIGYKLEMTQKNTRYFEIVSSEGYSIYNPVTNAKEIHRPESKEYKVRQFLTKIFPLKDYNNPAFKSNLEINGKEEIEGKPCFVYKMMLDGPETYNLYYIDEVTFQIVKVKSIYTNEKGESKEFEYGYSNFQKAKDGSYYPLSISTPFGIATVKSYQFDEPVGGNEFVFDISK